MVRARGGAAVGFVTALRGANLTNHLRKTPDPQQDLESTPARHCVHAYHQEHPIHARIQSFIRILHELVSRGMQAISENIMEARAGDITLSHTIRY